MAINFGLMQQLGKVNTPIDYFNQQREADDNSSLKNLQKVGATMALDKQAGLNQAYKIQDPNQRAQAISQIDPEQAQKLQGNDLALGQQKLEVFSNVASYFAGLPDDATVNTEYQQALPRLQSLFPGVQLPDQLTKAEALQASEMAYSAKDRLAAQLTLQKNQLNQPLEKVVGPDGVVTYTPRSEAAGKQAYVSGGTSLTVDPVTGQVTYSQGGSAGGLPKQSANAVGKADEEELKRARADAGQADTLLTTIKQYEAALDKTNPAALGPLVSKGANLMLPGQTKDQLQVLESTGNSLTLQSKSILGMPSANFSDSDRNFVTAVAPGRDKSQPANKQILRNLEAMGARTREYANFAEAYIQKNGNLLGAKEAWQRFGKENSIIKDGTADMDAVKGWQAYTDKGYSKDGQSSTAATPASQNMGVNPANGRQLSYDDFVTGMKQVNPNATDDQINAAWQQKYQKKNVMDSAHLNEVIPKVAASIAQVESGGNYGAIGPVTRTGDRALGKYQVMAKNVPVWTKEVLGKALSPQQFLNDPEAQEAVAHVKMAQAYIQHGSIDDVASVWFSGRPAKGNNSSDVTGTSVPKYVRNVRNNYARA